MKKENLKNSIAIDEKDFQEIAKVDLNKKSTLNSDSSENQKPLSSWKLFLQSNKSYNVEYRGLNRVLKNIRNEFFDTLIFQQYNKALLNQKGFCFEKSDFDFLNVKQLFPTANLFNEDGTTTNKIVRFAKIANKDLAQKVVGSYPTLNKGTENAEIAKKVCFTLKVAYKDKDNKVVLSKDGTPVMVDAFYTLREKEYFTYYEVINVMRKIKESNFKAQKSIEKEAAKVEKEAAKVDKKDKTKK